MDWFYIAVTIILFIIWVVATGAAVLESVETSYGGGPDLKVVAAISTGAFFAILVWPLTVALAIARFLCYGAYSAVSLASQFIREKRS